jgi:hypothetical protein
LLARTVLTLTGGPLAAAAGAEADALACAGAGVSFPQPAIATARPARPHHQTAFFLIRLSLTAKQFLQCGEPVHQGFELRFICGAKSFSHVAPGRAADAVDQRLALRAGVKRRTLTPWPA